MIRECVWGEIWESSFSRYVLHTAGLFDLLQECIAYYFGKTRIVLLTKKKIK